MPIILGIDPGSRITGYGVINIAGSKQQYIASGCIRINEDNFAAKLQKIFTSICEIINLYKPEEAAIEQVFVHANVNSALKLGQARGAAIVAIAHQGLIDVAEYSARQVKLAVVGYGNAEKAQVQRMIQMMLGLKTLPQADEADALAIAICHANSRKINNLINGSRGL